MTYDQDDGVLSQGRKCGGSRSGRVLDVFSRQSQKAVIAGCRWDATEARHQGWTPGLD